jgi:branched-chain amino acid transport system ATP-binding protein
MKVGRQANLQVESSATKVAQVPAIELRGIHAGYERNVVLRDISLSVQPAAVTALLGPNGAGKTTLLKVMSGLLRPTSGQVILFGTDVTRWEAHRRAIAGVCHIPEGRGIFRRLTVRENLVLQSLPADVPRTIERAVTAFPALGQRLDQLAGTMSGGQQQMLAIARAYSRDFKLIFVDEPSLGLAPIIVDAIFEFLENLTSRDTTLVLVDQFVTRALAMANSVSVLSHGGIVFTGSPSELEGTDLFEQYLGLE